MIKGAYVGVSVGGVKVVGRVFEGAKITPSLPLSLPSQREEFTIYAEYCNNHPHAVSEMSSLQQKQQYAIFFEVQNNT